MAADPKRVDLVAALVLTFTTGIIDSVGYLGLDRVFTANMTGNIVILGMALSGVTNLPLLGPAIAFGSFLVGAALGGRILHKAPKGWSVRVLIAFAITGLTALGLGIAALVIVPVPGSVWAEVVTGALAAAMGIQAAAARRLGVIDVTTVVITSTIVAFASESWIAGGGSKHWPRRVIAVGLYLTGAAAGALLQAEHFGLGLLIAGATIVVALSLAHLRHRRIGLTSGT